MTRRSCLSEDKHLADLPGNCHSKDNNPPPPKKEEMIKVRGREEPVKMVVNGAL